MAIIKNTLKQFIHFSTGAIALVLIAIFWLSTIISELFGTIDQVIWVKLAIPYGLLILIPAIITTGASGISLGKNQGTQLLWNKKQRIKIVALIGILILFPSVIFLRVKASRAEFDNAFYIIQIVELVAGAINFSLILLNLYSGLALVSKRKKINKI